MKTFKQKSTVKYDKNWVLEDDVTKEIFQVVDCEPSGNFYLLTLKKHNYTCAKIIDTLRESLEKTNLHEKELFAINNIIDQLEDEIHAN